MRQGMFASKKRSKKKAHLSGNNTVQPKLKIGQPGDKYEREADRVADAVMRMPDSKAQMQPGRKDRLQMKRQMPEIQRMCPRCRERARQGKALNCPDCEKKLQVSPAIQMQSLAPQIQMMRPCPPTLTESEDTPEGWKDYQGNACVFHCCYRGILEDRMPEPDDPQNECFYDSYGRLVDENHENADCGGTPNQYDSDRNPLKHTFLDEGGILSSGWSAFWESRFRSEDRSDRE